MVKVEDTDLDQTVIVVTHPRAKNGPRSQVHVITNPAPSQHEPVEPRGRVFLLDQHPGIHIGMSRRDIRPGWDWHQLEDQKTSDWRAWEFLQNWRRFIHGAVRQKWHQRCWNQKSELLKMWKARGRGQTGALKSDHWLLREFPDEPTTFPNARLIDRQDASASSGDPRGSAEGTRRRRRILHH